MKIILTKLYLSNCRKINSSGDADTWSGGVDLFKEENSIADYYYGDGSCRKSSRVGAQFTLSMSGIQTVGLILAFYPTTTPATFTVTRQLSAVDTTCSHLKTTYGIDWYDCNDNTQNL